MPSGHSLLRQLEDLERAHTDSPGDIAIIHSALDVLMRAERFHFAEKWIQRAETLRGRSGNPNERDPQILRASALMQELHADYATASATWARAFQIDATLGGDDFPLIRTSMYAGNLDQAESSARAELSAVADPWSFRGALLQRYLGEILLRRGDAAGFEMYIGRLYNEGRYFAFPDIPWWAGQELNGRHILFTHHDGFGDQILWQSVMPHLLRAGCRITLSTDHALAELFANSLPACRVIAADRSFGVAQAPDPAFLAAVRADPPDFQATLMHAPIAALRNGAPPNLLFTPYLTVPARAQAITSDALAQLRENAGGRKLIGIAWDSRQRHAAPDISDALWALGERRSLPPELFNAFCDDPHIAKHAHFVALHTHDHLAEYPYARPTNLSQSARVAANFAETAALMQACDAVITIDTCIANLAAFMGNPAVVAVGLPADWRYGVVGDTAPWLPAVSILRISIPHVWDTIFAGLREFVARLSAPAVDKLEHAESRP